MLLNPPTLIDATPQVKHRYWRIYVTDTNYPTPGVSADAVSIAEITWTDFAGLSVPKPGTVVITTGSQFSSAYSGAKAYDNNPGTFWSGNGPMIPDWIAFDFGVGAAFEFRRVAMKPRTDSLYTQAPRDFQIQYSDNGSVWTTYWSKTGIVWAAGVEQTFDM